MCIYIYIYMYVCIHIYIYIYIHIYDIFCASLAMKRRVADSVPGESTLKS